MAWGKSVVTDKKKSLACGKEKNREEPVTVVHKKAVLKIKRFILFGSPAMDKHSWCVLKQIDYLRHEVIGQMDP